MQLQTRAFVASAKAPLSRRVAICRVAESEAPAAAKATVTQPAAAGTPANVAELPKPEWVPEAVLPAVEFLNRTDFKLQDWDFYKSNLQQYVENKYVTESTGFKALPEIINGRAAMLGFVAGASAEILGAGPLLLQLSKYPQPVLAVMLLITAGSIIPVVKGSEGGYLQSLRETYTIPEGVFTESLERVHARLAMTGVGAMVLIELLKGSALL
uniref:Uncharacterized protein n=1 Tax=Tetradesmus obliquus TaxID=3088 RepID=A0A383VDQ8_TETOB|eukprot:jgi/Sobl393_1/4411/SZX63685.1